MRHEYIILDAQIYAPTLILRYTALIELASLIEPAPFKNLIEPAV